MKSHLRNSITVLLTLFVLGLTAFGPLCGTACAASAKAACCEGNSQCDAPVQVASNDAACGHAVVMVAERVEQPVVAASFAYVIVPGRAEFAQPRVVVTELRGRVTDLPPPQWFDPLLVSLRV